MPELYVMPSFPSKVKTLSDHQQGSFQVYLHYIPTMLGPNRPNYSDYEPDYY